jgi:hypothetical protein
MRRNLWSGNQEVPPTPGGDGPSGRADEATNRDAAMHVGGKSDNRVVPTKRPNNGGSAEPLAEAVEGRRLTEGNVQQTTTPRTQSRIGVSLGLLGVREAARRDKRARFTNLLHHVGVMDRKVRWVLDADIRGFTPSTTNGCWFVEHRIADPSTANFAPVSQRSLLRQTPEVGAVCGKSARTDLCGGRPARAVPTATPAHDGVNAPGHSFAHEAPRGASFSLVGV